MRAKKLGPAKNRRKRSAERREAMAGLGKRLLSGLFGNCACPRGAGGRLMLRFMNLGHGRVYRWVMESCPFANGMRVLDVGCGGGGAARALRRRFPGMRVDGVDLSEESVAMCRKVAGMGGEFRVGSAEALPAADGSYDAAVSIESVYFWPDLGRGLREMRRVLREGGFAAVEAKVDSKSGLACVVGRKDVGGGE